MAGFTNDIMNADNVNFTGSNPTIGDITADGQFMIGNAIFPFLRPGTLTSPGSTMSFGYSSPNITADATGTLPLVNLPDTTSSTLGVVNINGNRFMHKYGDADNVFVGTNAGNFTNTTALANTGVGSGSLTALTTGDNNTAVGKGALAALTTSTGVTAIGRNAMTLAQTGCTSTTVLGNNAFSSFVSGSGGTNVIIGNNCGQSLTTSTGNTLIGSGSVSAATVIGANNVAVGIGTLNNLSSGLGNVAIGSNTMGTGVVTGNNNVGFGTDCLKALTSGATNCAMGMNSMFSATSALQNTCIGASTMTNATTAIGNSVLGYNSLFNLAGAGKFNIVLGHTVGNVYTTTESSNILINGGSTVGESNVCRIGNGTGTGDRQLNATFISGVFGKTVGVSGLPVVIDNFGQCGTVVSSIRYKENIQDLNELSSRVLYLRPVIFNYKDKELKSYGLIAEEVNEIMPELVVRNLDDEIEGVKYQDLPILLLNELKKAFKRIEDLENKIIELCQRF